MANRSRSNDFDKAASAYIRATAGLRKLSQKQVADQAGIPINTFKPYWHGDRAMRLGDFEAVLEVLGVDGEEAMRDIKRLLATGQYTR